jgi:hypothetical protein
MKTALITFKTKIQKLHEGDGSVSLIVNYKRNLSRHDCNLRPNEHTYYNSDLFLGMLQRAYSTATNGKEWARIASLPESVKVDASGFLATVTVTLPESFAR